MTLVFFCPLFHPDATWCMGCRFAKELLCDWPYSLFEVKNESKSA